MNCKLGDGKVEFINDMNRIITSSANSADPVKQFKSELSNLLSKYSNNMDDFKESVKEYLEDSDGVYEITTLLEDDETIANAIINSTDNVFNDIITEMEERTPDKLGSSLSSDFKEKSQIRQQFLDKYFKYNSSSKLLFLKDFKNSAIRSIFISEDEDGNKYLIDSSEEMNESIQKLREKLLNDVRKVLAIRSNQHTIDQFEFAYKIDSNSAIKNFLDNIFNNESIFPKTLIARLPEINSDSLNENSKTLLKGFQAYIALKHFDDLLAQTFQKAISIKNHGEYNLNNSDKYSIKTADRVIHQWRDEEIDVDETEELGSLPMLFVQSLQIHDKTGRVKNETLEFSNVKVAIGHLMKILDVQQGSDFLGQKFPTNIISQQITQIILKEYQSIYGKDYLNWILNTYVKGKTFKQVLASAKRFPEILMPILFRLTQPVNNSNVNINPYSSIFNKQSKTDETITSLYYEMYSPENYSVFSMNTGENGFDPNKNSIFQHVNTMFLNIENKQQLEYLKDEEKGITAVNLGDRVGNTRLKLFQRALETKYDKVNPLSQTNSDGEEQFQNFSIIDNLEKEEENESPDGKSITIKIDNKQIIVNSDLTYKVLDENGKNFHITEQNLRCFTKLFNEVLDLDFNEAFISILRSQGGTLKDVLGLVSRMLYNFQVGKHMINTSSTAYDRVVKQYYTINDNNKKLPNVSYSSVQPRIISSSDNKGIMSKVSKVKDILEGYSEINTVQDGERKQVSTLGLSSLLSKYNEIIENYGKNPESPIKHFSIFGMYEGAELMRDYAEPGNNKQAKKFTEAELVTASFLYDMYGDLMELDDDDNLQEKSGGILRVMGPVVSDKGNLIKLKYNWDSTVKEKYQALLRPDDPTKPLRLRDLTVSDLKTIIKEEFGEYYQNVLNYVQSQYDILNNNGYLDKALTSLGYPVGLKLDYLSSFKYFNASVINPQTGKSDALKVLREAIYLAQQAGEEIEIIDQVHYTLNKNGELQNNPSLIHQLQVFGKMDGGEQYEDFWKRKENQLFIDFLQTETELQVKEGVNDKKGVAIQVALQKNNGWIKGENIAIAKVSEITQKKEGEETKEDSRSLLISTKDDFKNWYPYKSLLNYYGKEIPSKLNIDSPDADLEAIMNAIDQYSVVRKLSEEETLNKIIEAKSNKWKTNIKGEDLLRQAYILYSATRHKYNKDIPEERIQEDFKKKQDKEFTKDGKLDKKALVDYINKKETLQDIETIIDPLLDTGSDLTYLDPFIESLEKSNYNVELNPEFVKHNLYDFLLSEEFVLSTTGSHISQPGKSSNIVQREAEQFGNAVKRYVAYTASKHREEANALNGITEDINLAIIEDDKDFSFNFVGESGTDKPFDGASFYNIIMNYLDNNSLGGDAMGVDKKPFAHYQGTKSGIGFILKTAGFAHTNDRIRNSKFDARLNKQMNDIKWDSPKVQRLINPNWKSGDKVFIPNWTQDYFDKAIDYGEWFAYRQNQDGTWSWYKHRINNGNIELIKVLSNGQEINGQEWVKYSAPINSNYDLWNAFGGAYSGHIQENSDGSKSLVYEHDEGSILRLLKAVNNVGIRRTINGKPIEKVFDQNGVNQYLKKACIHIVATGGAVKYGGANINPKEAYYDDNYHLTHMVIKSYDLGEQLDAEHSAEDGHVALMTQVVNALGARGYTSQEAMQCYQALSNIAEYITGDILKAMETDDPELIDKVIEKSIYKTLLQASDNDGDMLNALAASLLNGKDPSSKNISEIAKNFPISHPAVFNKILSSFASQLEKGIKLKFEGGMYVLNPSNRRMTVINGHLSGYYDTRRKIYKGKDSTGRDNYVDELEELEAYNIDHPIKSVADIKLGYNYRDSDTDELFIINKPTDIYKIKELISQGHTFYETVVDREHGNIPLGRDLTTYQLSFYDTEGNRYNSWELDSVRMLQYLQTDKKGNEIGFKIPPRETNEDATAFQTRLQANWDTLSPLQKAFNIYKNNNLLSLLRVDQQEEVQQLSLPEEVQKYGVKNFLVRKFQEDLNAISSGIETEVQVEGRRIKVDKNKVDITPFGIILPPIYKTQFGLKEQDILSDIEKDKTFFVKRQLENWKPKLTNQNVYDLELKVLSGEHIYLARLTEDFIPNPKTQQEVQLEFPTNFEWDGDVLYRITPLGKRLYSVPYTTDRTGNVVPDIRVFKDKSTGIEVIYSRNLTHFLDEFNYSELVFSQRIPFDSDDYESEEEYKQALLNYKGDLLRQVYQSNNRTAIRKINQFVNVSTNRVNSSVNDDLKVDSLDVDWLINKASDVLLDLIHNDVNNINENIAKLQQDLNNNTDVDALIANNRYFAGLIKSGIDVHTSFLESLEFVVSRTPAQSQQSFMAMKVEAFGLEGTNSAYVSRDQLWLQGSDYDIDKISLLGLKFNHGKLVTWSPFFSLKSREEFLASKKLPFPTNKELPMLPVNNQSKIPYNVLRNDLTVIDPEDSQFGEMTITTPQSNGLIIRHIPGVLGFKNSVEISSITDWENVSELEKYVLIRRAYEALQEFDGRIIFNNFDIPVITRASIGLSGDGYLTGTKDINSDFEEFNHAIIGDQQIHSNIIQYAPNLGTLIQVYNDLGYIPESQNNLPIKQLVDTHNTSIKGKSLIDSLYNFISIKVKDISADPANRIQGQSPIDPEMDKIKDLVNDSEQYPENQKLAGFIKKFDRGSMYSKIKMLTLTLGGKEGVGIEASSLKNFELSSQYIYDTLDKGTLEDQEDLLFNVKINGKTYEILANSRARNIDTVKSRKVREVLKRVNQYQDTYLTKSGLLSLSTDNAKDPKLPQLNCDPTMMPLYDAGVMLGMSVNELASLILTDTGILINKISKSNIFTGKQEKGRVIDVIRYLQRAPQINLTDSQLKTFEPLFQRLGILKEIGKNPDGSKKYEPLNKTRLGSILLNKSLRGQLKEVFRFLQNPSEDYSLLEFKKNRVVNNIISSLYGSKDYKGFSQRAENYFKELESLEGRSEEQEKTYQELLSKRNKKLQVQAEIDYWEKYKEGIIPNKSIKVGDKEIGQQINDLDSTLNNYTKDDFKSELKRIQGNIFSSRQYLSNIKDIYSWLTYQDVVEETIEDENRQKHRVLWQLLKLAEIAEEQSVLRPLMSLNQGLANKVEEQIKFYTDFSKIISDRIEVLGKERALRKGNTGELLTQLKQINDDLRASGVINSKEPYYVDLHTFLYNPEYNKLVKNIYGNIKCTTNIFKVVDSIPNYKKYLRLADGSVTISNRKSRHFRTLQYIEDVIIPETNVKRSKWLEQMRKNATSYINRQKNNDFLLSQNVQLRIPSFKIENGKLTYLSSGIETIQLGIDKKNDQKFKQYVEFILFPQLKEKYPDNKFLQYLGYRVFDFNDDHNSSINLSKIKTNNMDNPSDLAQFNLAKLDMLELDKEDVTKLFYYNLIAYNNQSGQSSLTILFDDIIRNNSLKVVNDYNQFITEWDKKPISQQSYIDTMKAIAPVLKLFEVNSGLRLKYFYVQNPEDKKTYLCYKLPNQKNNEDDFDDYDNDNYDNEEGNVRSFRTRIYDAGYGIFSLPKQEIKGKEVPMLEFGTKHKYRISQTTNLDQVQIFDGRNWRKPEEVLEIAKSKGISFKDSGEVVKNLTEIFEGGAKNIKNKLKELGYKLDAILYDESINKC